MPYLLPAAVCCNTVRPPVRRADSRCFAAALCLHHNPGARVTESERDCTVRCVRSKRPGYGAAVGVRGNNFPGQVTQICEYTFKFYFSSVRYHAYVVVVR